MYNAVACDFSEGSSPARVKRADGDHVSVFVCSLKQYRDAVGSFYAERNASVKRYVPVTVKIRFFIISAAAVR